MTHSNFDPYQDTRDLLALLYENGMLREALQTEALIEQAQAIACKAPPQAAALSM